MTDLDLTEATAAAQEAAESSAWRPPRYTRTVIAEALAAAAPVLERQVRERIAADIEARRYPTKDEGRSPKRHGYNDGLQDAARIARDGVS